MAELEILHEKKKVLQILEKIPQFLELRTLFEKVEYLAILKNAAEQEKFLFENYLPIMKVAAASYRPFTDFSQENYDTLTRMKWRWANI
jgi:hypothetical protein